MFEAHRPAQHDARKRAPTASQGADAASHESSHQRPLKRQLAGPGAGVAQEAQAHNTQPRLGASAAPAYSPQQTSALPNYLQANNRVHLPTPTAGTAATHDATGAQMATASATALAPAQALDHATELSAANQKKPTAADADQPARDPAATLEPGQKAVKHGEHAAAHHGAKDAATHSTRGAAAASGISGKAAPGKAATAPGRSSAPATSAASKEAAAPSAQPGQTRPAGRAPVGVDSKTAAPAASAGGGGSVAVAASSSAGAPSGGDAGGAAGGAASPGAEQAMSAASGTEAGGAAEAIQEKTEDKMAAANPQGAAEEAQADVAPAAEGGGAESGAQGESETGAGEGAAADDQAAGATESEAAAPPQQEAEKSTTAASGSASTDPDAQQREQTSQESREHQADSRRVAEGDSEEHAQDQTEHQADASAGASAPADAEMSSGEKGAGLSDLSEEVAGGGEGAGGAVSGGGGAAAPAAAEDGPAPDTAAQDPADGLASAASLSPVQAGAALTGVSSAVNRTANEEAGALQEQIPSPEVGGDGASASAVQTLPGDSITGKPAAVHPGSSTPTPAPAPLPAAGPAPSERVVTPSVRAGEGGTVAAEDATRVQGAVEDLPTHDPGLDVPVGAPPQVQLSGDADPAAAEQQKAELDQTVTVQRARGAADAGADAGENAIRVTRPKEIIKAPEIAKGGAGASTSAIDAGASEQSIGIIANEKRGPEVRAAMVKAQADMATKKGEHQEKVSQEKTRNDEKMAALKDENLAQQQVEKAGAKSEVAKARNDWTAEQRKTIAETNEKAGKEVAKGHKKVNQEQAQGDKQASDHLATGEKEASAAKVNAERDASAKKAEGKQESGGIFGWLSSKVTSFFNKIKNGITAIFDAAKKAVRWAIDKAKKAAVAAIELARKAIVSVIKAVGAALMALGDVLLAAFPSLRKRFRSFIESKVRAAENAVNRLADALKKGVTKLLDLLGKAFEFLLDAYKKGMLMVLDAAHAVVNGAIKFAKAVADLVGTFIVLIKDIAANPGGWISNLGAAVMDGVKNHLWKAFKTAVSGWFNDKLEEVLGVGLTIWNVLKKGGISIKEVGKMAFEALKAAIPSALIQLLIEKVVAMIVPAAGAVMAIIEGLQAAWGTVQRIIAALGKFVSFLKAVKAGGAGPQFAELLAAAAIVVIDFVANWLLKKLRGPASKVGSKVKAIAQKIMAKVKAAMKKVGGALKKVAKKIGGVFKKGSKKFADWRAKRKAKKAGKEKGKKDDKAARLRKAVDAIRPNLQQMIAKGKVSGLLVRAKLLFWRARYRLRKLALEGSGDNVHVVAQINPSEKVIDFVRKHGANLRKIIYEVAEEIFQRPDVQASMKRLQADMAAGKGSGASKKNRLAVNNSADSVALAGIMRSDRPPGTTFVSFAGGGKASVSRREMFPDKTNSKTSLGPGNQLVNSGGDYVHHPDMFNQAAAKDSMSPALGGQAMTSLANVTFAGGASKHRDAKTRDFAARQALLKITEMSRNDQAMVISSDVGQQVGTGQIPHTEGVSRDPMTGLRPGKEPVTAPTAQQQVERGVALGSKEDREKAVVSKDAVQNARTLEERTRAHEDSPDMKGDVAVREDAVGLKQMINQQVHFIATVLEARYGAENMMFNGQHGLMESVRKDVRAAVLDITTKNLALPTLH